MTNKSRYSRIVKQLSEMSDKEVRRIKTSIEIECANRDLPNQIDLSVDKMNDYQLTVLFATLYQHMRERGVIPDRTIAND